VSADEPTTFRPCPGTTSMSPLVDEHTQGRAHVPLETPCASTKANSEGISAPAGSSPRRISSRSSFAICRNLPRRSTLDLQLFESTWSKGTCDCPGSNLLISRPNNPTSVLVPKNLDATAVTGGWLVAHKYLKKQILSPSYLPAIAGRNARSMLSNSSCPDARSVANRTAATFPVITRCQSKLAVREPLDINRISSWPSKFSL